MTSAISTTRQRPLWHTLAHFQAAMLMFGCSASPSESPQASSEAGAAAAGGAVAASGGAGGAGGALIRRVSAAGTGGLVAPGCRREVSLKTVPLREPPPFDVVIVADNSDSLSWSREDLSAGLTDWLASVQGYSARVFLLTSTQYGASSAPAQQPLSGTPIVDYQNAVSGRPYSNAMTLYSQTCTDPAKHPITCPDGRSKEPYEAHGTWAFAMPQPIAVITPDLTPEAFAAQQRAVRDAIVALSGGGGSPHEQPICTLARYLHQERSELPKDAVFIVIADEDDASTPQECLASVTTSVSAVPDSRNAIACTAACDAYRYTALADVAWQRWRLDCASFDDTGAAIAGSEVQTWLNHANISTCEGFAERPCTSQEAAQAAPICPTGHELVRCQQTCASFSSPCILDLPDTSVNACTQPFSKDGERYADLADYCTKTGGLSGPLHDCTPRGINYQAAEQRTGVYDPVPLVPGTSTRDLIDDVRNQATSQLGAGHYLFEAITLSPNAPCELGPGQSYANNLLMLAQDSSHIFPLCESYAAALRGVTTFSQRLVQREFPLSLRADERVTTVEVLDAKGSMRLLGVTQFRYDATSQLLRIEPDVLSASDTGLRVEVSAECTPVLF